MHDLLGTLRNMFSVLVLPLRHRASH